MIRIWNAFASNNSGSYVIVGSFASEQVAAEVAAELLELARAQSAWMEKGERPSPLDALADKLGAPHEEPYETWPEHSNTEHPDVLALGRQVLVHSDYTITMPKLLGHAMYARGGRVQTEINHAHHAIIATFECWFTWEERGEIDVPARVQDIVDALWAPDGALSQPQHGTIPPAWRGVVDGEPKFGEVDLVLGVAFRELAAGFVAVQAAVTAHGARMRVNVAEAHGPDPIAYLRPSVPCTRHALVDIWLEKHGEFTTSLTKLIVDELYCSYEQARARIDAAPGLLFAGLTHARASELRDALVESGAQVTLRPSAATRVESIP
jgi:hypothetical protein